MKNWILSWSRNIFNPLIYHIFNPLLQSAIRWVLRCSARSADQRTPLHEYKITHESQHAHTVMEKVDSTSRHSWLHSSCLVAQQENSSPPRLSESDFPPAPQRWINQTNFRPELIHTFHTTLRFLFLFQRPRLSLYSYLCDVVPRPSCAGKKKKQATTLCIRPPRGAGDSFFLWCKSRCGKINTALRILPFLKMMLYLDFFLEIFRFTPNAQ